MVNQDPRNNQGRVFDFYSYAPSRLPSRRPQSDEQSTGREATIINLNDFKARMPEMMRERSAEIFTAAVHKIAPQGFWAKIRAWCAGPLLKLGKATRVLESEGIPVEDKSLIRTFASLDNATQGKILQFVRKQIRKSGLSG